MDEAERGLKPDGLAEVADRGVEVAEVDESRSEVAQDLGVLRV